MAKKAHSILVIPFPQILFPGTALTVELSSAADVAVVHQVVNEELDLVCVPQGYKQTRVGTTAKIAQLQKTTTPGAALAVTFKGLARVGLELPPASPTSPPTAYVTHTIADVPLKDDAVLDRFQTAAAALIEALPSASALTKRLNYMLTNLSAASAPAFADALIASMPVSPLISLAYDDKLEVLLEPDADRRVASATAAIERMAAAIRRNMAQRAQGSKQARAAALRKRLGALQQELAALGADDAAADPEAVDDDDSDDFSALERRVATKQWTPAPRRIARRELNRLKKTPPQGAEFGVIRNYLDWLLALPWVEATPLRLDAGLLEAARAKLDADHYGMDKVKKRIVEWLAVMYLSSRGSTSTAMVSAQRDSTPPSPSPPATSLVPYDAEEALKRTSHDKDTPSTTPSPPATAEPPTKGPILLLCGPPGTGKTSIAKSIADALGRKFHRISLGGVRDEAEIRGHRRTYVGALPGALAQALRRTGVRNPVILLDEIDKVATSRAHGDPAAALLEVLDPEQNHAFVDHYLGTGLDLSRVLFIATANTLDTIPEALYDRMEPIELPGYVHSEKVEIARRYLLPKQIRANALSDDLLRIPDDATFLRVVTEYTREPGVRSLERELGALCRAKAVELAAVTAAGEADATSGGEASAREGDHGKASATDSTSASGAVGVPATYTPIITPASLEALLGPPRYLPDTLGDTPPGVVLGLAYQGSGNGGLLHVETSAMRASSAGFELTGQLGDVISESARVAFAWVRTHAAELGLAAPGADVFADTKVHLHLPAGAVRKDGPSAGVAMSVALVSLLARIPVAPLTAMTGELTLRGAVAPVGGIREKVLAAHRAGVRTVLLPHLNERDVKTDLPPGVQKEMRFVYLHTVWEALDAAFSHDTRWTVGGRGGARRGGLAPSHAGVAGELMLESRL